MGDGFYARNPESGKTAIVNADNGVLLGVYRGGNFRLLSNGRVFLGETDRGIMFVDASSGKETDKLKLGNRGLQVSSDERYAVALTSDARWSSYGSVVCVDLAAKKIIAEVKDFKGAEQIVLVEPPATGER